MQKSDFPFFHPLRVRYSEVDAQGVVYNSHYLTYYDIAITEVLRHIDFDYGLATMQRTGKDFHTVKGLVEYRAPLFYDDEIEVHIRPERIGRSSITWGLAIFYPASEELLATGEVVWVYADMKEHKSTPLPEELLGKLAVLQ